MLYLHSAFGIAS